MRTVVVGSSISAAIVVSALSMVLAAPGVAAAQDVTAPAMSQAPPPAVPSAQPEGSKTTDDPSKKKTDVQKPGKANDRLFGFLPNFMTVNGSDLTPLTTKQKYSLVSEGSFDIVEYPWYAAMAGISQANGSEAGYGTGLTGYTKRYAAAFADGTIENFMAGAVLPSLWHEDPRYFRMGKGRLVHRLEYSVSRIVVTKTDSGHTTFNFSEIVGSGLGAALAIPYHPREDRTLTNTVSVWRTMVAYDTLTILIKEFWPDIHHVLGRMF